MWMTRGKLLKLVDGARVRAEIESAEQKTSGEIRVSVAPLFWGDVRAEAEKAFVRLGMTQTRQRNGVLIFVVPSRRRFVILGDEGIHAAVGQVFWEKLSEILTRHFKVSDFTAGLIECIHSVGEQLAAHFPHEGKADTNELSDEVDLHPQ